MTRVARIGWLLAALAAASVLAVTPVEAAESPTSSTAPQLTETPSSSFPAMSYVLSLPKPAELTAESLSVLENGEPVLDVALELPQESTATTFGIVLLIDASMSMEGEPIKQAMAAARAFTLEVNEGTQVSVVLFNNKVTTLVPFTADLGAVANAVATTPKLAFGTRIHDAVRTAEDELANAGISFGSIVLLSDGSDVGSNATLKETLAGADNAGPRIFTVGLDSDQFEPETLRSLAKTTGGTFAVATRAKDLTAIYRSIGDIISSAYVLSYESFALPGATVSVVVKVPGFDEVATTAYAAPVLPGDAVSDASWWDSFIQSSAAALVVSALIIALVGLGTFLLVRRRDRSVEQRLSQFVTLPPEEQARIRRQDVQATLAEHQDLSPVRRSFRQLAVFKRLEEDVEIGRVPLSAGTIVVGSALASVGFAFVGVALIGPWGVFAVLIPGLVARWFVSWKLRKLRSDFGDQLPETLDVVSSALRAGHSLAGALKVAVDGAPEPSRSELGRAIADEQLGVPLEDALRVVAHRMTSRDLTQVALVAQLQREAGTNAAEVIDQVSMNIRNRLDLHRLVRTLTAQGRMSRWIVSILPLFLFVAIYFLNNEYLSPLWETNAGKAALVLAIAMIVSGSLVIKKIVEIEV